MDQVDYHLAIILRACEEMEMKLKYVIIRDIPDPSEEYESDNPIDIREEEQSFIDQGIYSYDELFEGCAILVYNYNEGEDDF